MAEEFRKVTRDELEELAGEALPERAAMSLIKRQHRDPGQRGGRRQCVVRRLDGVRQRGAADADYADQLTNI